MVVFNLEVCLIPTVNMIGKSNVLQSDYLQMYTEHYINSMGAAQVNLSYSVHDANTIL